MDYTKIIDALNLSTGRLFAFCIVVVLASSLVLFGPDQVLGPLGVKEVGSKYEPFPGLSLVLSGVGTLVTGLIYLGSMVRSKIGRFLLVKNGGRGLQNLTPGERVILRRYIYSQSLTQWLRLDNGVARELVSERIIYQSSSEGHILNGFPHNIRPWAWDYLSAHPHLVAGD